MKRETKLKLFYIYTFGIGYYIAKKKAKQRSKTINNNIKVMRHLDFNIEDLILALGGINNIKNVNSTISNLKVCLNNIENINIDLIKKLGAIGTIKNLDSITILFGDNSQYIAELLNQKLCK